MRHTCTSTYNDLSESPFEGQYVPCLPSLETCSILSDRVGAIKGAGAIHVSIF